VARNYNPKYKSNADLPTQVEGIEIKDKIVEQNIIWGYSL